MDLLDRSHVDATRRLVEHDERPIDGHLSAEDDLLLAAPRKGAEGGFNGARRDVEAIADFGGERFGPGSVEQPPAHRRETGC